ncbi:MAG TPA: NPCBM/NEW2 domain-containing protein [Planctomycetota bacterium]|nr:NPCBM/NEW2 domain-containing protein [Planctomycetota bacterium]
MASAHVFVVLAAFLVAAPQDSVREVSALVLVDAAGAVRRIPVAEAGLDGAGASEVLFARPVGLPAGQLPVGADVAWLSLHAGDRVRARVRGGAGDLLRVELADGAEWVVSVERLASVEFEGRLRPEVASGLTPADSGDVLWWIREGGGIDRVPGTLVEFGAAGASLESSFGVRSYPWSEVAALFVEALDEESARRPRSAARGLVEGAAASVDLIDGGRLHGLLRGLDAATCTLETAPGRSIDLPLWCVAEIAIDDGRARYLSELEPARAEEGSAFGDDLGLAWPHRRDRAVTGAPLRAGGRTWRRGLGVHAPSRLTYALDGDWARLSGSVAVDDSVLRLAARGSVVFRVLVDGEARFESGVLRGGDGPKALDVDLTGARGLVLEVDMDGDHFVADRADWLGLLLSR